MRGIDCLSKAKMNDWKICVYGLGKVYNLCSRVIFSALEIEPDYYCDKDDNVLKLFPEIEEKKITIDRLLAYEEDILVIMFLGARNRFECINKLHCNERIRIIDAWVGDKEGLIYCDAVLKYYFQLDKLPDGQLINENSIEEPSINANGASKKENPRVAVYTCITGGYDSLIIPEVVCDNWDYYYISDVLPGKSIKPYQYMNVFEVCPKSIHGSTKNMNRYCKTHAASIFQKYDYCIYIDGNVQIVSDLELLIERINKYGFSVHSNRIYDSYTELMITVMSEKTTYEKAKQTVEKMTKAGYPRYYGGVECAEIITDIKNRNTKALMDEWYNTYMEFPTKRDQPALAYTMWKNGIAIKEVTTLLGDQKNDGYFYISDKIIHKGSSVESV